MKDSKVDVSVIEVPFENMKTDIFHIISDNYETTSAEKAIIKDGIKFYISSNNGKAKYSKEEIIEYISLISKESNINIYDIGSQALDENLNFLFNAI